MDARIRWSRLVAEGGIVVLSILLAFAIDAWWSRQGQRAKEEVAVEGIAQDFARHQALLATHRDGFETRLDATVRLLGWIGPDAEGSDPAIDSVLGVAGMVSTVQFEGGTLETLVATDGLALLQDDELRAALSAWRQRVDDLAAINEFIWDEAVKFGDLLRTRYSIQDLDRAAGLTSLPPSGFDARLQPLLRDLEFSNAVYQNHYATRVMLAYLTTLEEIAGRVLARTGAGS